MHIPVLYEDNHLLVIEKPINVPVQQDKSGDPDLLNLLKHDLKLRYNKPGNVYLGLVHRLDRPVGGVMVFAKTSKGASRISDSIRKGELDKTYLAVVRGTPPKKMDKLEHYLLKDSDKNIVHVAKPQQKGAKKAVLEYETFGHEDGLSLLRIQLHTGRPHQIRVQLAAVGCPLYGDQKYGQYVNEPGEQIALWAHQLQFPHPTRDEIVRTASFPPNEYPWSLWEI